MEIPVLTQKKWYLCKRACAMNSLNIAKWFYKQTELEKFFHYRGILYRLKEEGRKETCNKRLCAITHNYIVNLMLDDIDRLYGRETWRIVRNNIQFANEEETIESSTDE